MMQKRLLVKLAGAVTGAAALLWFLLRVIPKPSRASYPCQRAAFPLASGFLLWLAGTASGVFTAARAGRITRRYRYLVVAICVCLVASLSVWMAQPSSSSAAEIATRYNWTPQDPPNRPLGVARGVNPGRVVWAHDPQATQWDGRWKDNDDKWWSDANTDQDKVDAMLSASLRKLTSTATDEEAWDAIFQYYNRRARNLDQRGYRAGEIVAVKINLNNSSRGVKLNNLIDASPQLTLAMVRQLIHKAHVAPQDVIVYDVRRNIYPDMLTKIWGEFQDVRFIQQDPPFPVQPKHPVYGDYRKLEQPDWVTAVDFSANSYKEARMIPRQILDATYLVNMAILKLHSYPWNLMEGGEPMNGGDEGQTAVTMCGKNLFGSVKGTPEMHDAINTRQHGTRHAYSPIVDLHASPNLGGKEILYILDALYCGKKHMSFPLHFPNPPFNNRVAPYENPEWPASVLASLDGVAIDSVGLDILYAQSKNNTDAKNENRPRIMIRENADDYLHEMALPDKAPSGTVYKQNGKVIASLGVFEHWDGDTTRQYSRNKDRVNGKGIELVYLPMRAAAVATPLISVSGKRVSIRCSTPGARIYYTTDGAVPTDHSPLYARPINIPAGGKVRAVAMSDALLDSAVASSGI